MFTPVGKSRNRIQGRKLFAFTVDFSDINKELGKFINGLKEDLKDEIKASRAEKKIVAHARGTLFQDVPRKSRRISAITQIMDKHNKYYTYGGSTRVLKKKAPIFALGLYNIEKLDKATNIARLDQKYPEYHYAPFQKPSKVKKAIGQKTKRMKRNSLWRILQYGRKSFYTIPTVEPGPVVYTSARDGFSRWHIRRTVKWFSEKPSTAGIYYLLSISKQMYDDDKRVFYTAVVKGVSKILSNRTRFR